jgi:hypothetical protein
MPATCRRRVNPTLELSGHFFGAAAEAMRRILVDQARHKQSHKRGGRGRRVARFPMSAIPKGIRISMLPHSGYEPKGHPEYAGGVVGVLPDFVPDGGTVEISHGDRSTLTQVFSHTVRPWTRTPVSIIWKTQHVRSLL